MAIDESTVGDVTVLHVSGQFDDDDAAGLRTRLVTMRTTRPRAVVVDLGRLAALGTAGVAALASLATDVEALGGVPLVVCGVAAARDSLRAAVTAGRLRLSASLTDAVREVNTSRRHVAVRRLARTPTSVRAARELVRVTVGSSDRDLVERAVLVTNEIVTDLVTHPPERRRVLLDRRAPIAVEVVYQDHVVRVVVTDPSPRDATAGPPPELGTVLDSFADAWGCHHLAGGGTSVWCRLDGVAA